MVETIDLVFRCVQWSKQELRLAELEAKELRKELNWTCPKCNKGE